MKALKIYESINFKRGSSNPHDTLNIGPTRGAEQWDNIEDYLDLCYKKIIDRFDTTKWAFYTAPPYYYNTDRNGYEFNFNFGLDSQLELMFIPPNENHYENWGWTINDFGHPGNYNHDAQVLTPHPDSQAIPEEPDLDIFLEKLRKII